MADFTTAVEFILQPGHEGGLEIDPNDPGGLTNFGISQRAYPHLDIRKLTRDGAVMLYRTDWWRYDTIRSQRIANKLLDQEVNFGQGGGTKILQAALQYFRMAVDADGVLGPHTLSAVNGVPPDELFKELAARAALAHCKDAIANPKLLPDLLGWLRRDIDG